MRYVYYLYEFEFYSFLLPLLMVAVLLCSRLYNKSSNLVVLLCISSISVEYTSYWLASHNIYNRYLFHLSNCSDVLLFLGLMQHAFFRMKAKKSTLLLVDFFAMICLIFGLIEGLDKDPVISSTIIHLGIILLVLYYYFEIFRYEYLENLSYNPTFWLNSMYLLFFSGTFAYQILLGETVSGRLSINSAIVNLILIIVFNLVFTLVLWLGRKRKISI